MLENIKLAFQGIWAHKMRSFLTMLGVIIGIASIMTIVSSIKGTNEQTRQNLIGSGNNALELVYTVEGGDPSAQTGVQAPISFPKDLMESIEDLSVIKSCAPYYSMQTQSYGESVYYGNTNLQGYLIGTTNDYLSVFGYQVQRGRAFVDRDFDNHQKVALIDESAASALFGIKDPVGKVLEIYGEPFEVVGVLQETAKRELKFNSAEEYMEYLQNVGYQDYGYSGKVLIPQVTWPIVAQYDATPNLAISARSTFFFFNFFNFFRLSSILEGLPPGPEAIFSICTFSSCRWIRFLFFFVSNSSSKSAPEKAATSSCLFTNLFATGLLLFRCSLRSRSRSCRLFLGGRVR